LYFSPSIIRMTNSKRTRRAGYISGMGTYRLLLGKPEGKRPLERQRRRWVDNIKIDLGEIGWVVWTRLVWSGSGPCECGNELGVP
jgi:hypothetical protein